MSQHLPSISDWVGAAPASPSPGGDGEPYTGCFFLQSISVLRTKHDKPYLRLAMLNRDGVVEGRVWDNAEAIQELVPAGSFIGVRGRVQLFNQNRQIVVDEIRQIHVEPSELRCFMPYSPRDPDVMEAELQALIAGIRDPDLGAVVRLLLDAGSESGRAFRVAPAAKTNHHAYIGGLLEHTISVAGTCRFLATHYAPVDAELLVAGALLHDIGKTREISREVGFPYRDEGKLLGHIVIGIEMVRDAARQVPELDPARLTLLLHLVASHQGKYEWHSPAEPRTLEALLLHYADDLDAKMNPAMALVGAAEEPGWTAYDRAFGRELLRHPIAQQAEPSEAQVRVEMSAPAMLVLERVAPEVPSSAVGSVPEPVAESTAAPDAAVAADQSTAPDAGDAAVADHDEPLPWEEPVGGTPAWPAATAAGVAAEGVAPEAVPANEPRRPQPAPAPAPHLSDPTLDLFGN